MKKKNILSKLIGIAVAFTMLLGTFPMTALARETPVGVEISDGVDIKVETYPYNIEGVNWGPEELQVTYIRDNSTIKFSKKPGYIEDYTPHWFADIMFLDDDGNIVDYQGLIKSGEITEEGVVFNISSNDLYCESYQSNLRNVIYQIRADYKENGEFKDAYYCYRIYDDVPQNLRTVGSSAFDITIDGKTSTFQSYITGEDYYSEYTGKYDGSEYYISIRDFAMAMNGTAKQFDIGYDAEKKAITLTSRRYT